MSAAVMRAVDDDQVTPGLLGFLIVAAMGVALFFLLRSMAKHLRRVDVGSAGDSDGDLDGEPGEGIAGTPPDTGSEPPRRPPERPA